MKSTHLSLTEELILVALKYGKLVNYADKEIVHARGDKSVGLSIIESGQVKFGNYGLDGQYRLTRMMTRGETFGEFTLFAHLPRTHTAESYGESRVLKLTQSGFHELCNAVPAFQTQIMALLAIKLHTCLEILDDITRLPLSVRLAKLLVSLQQQQHNKPEILITQTDLSTLLGVTVLSAHKALKKLTALGLIKPYYGGIMIHDSKQLIHWVEVNSSLEKLNKPKKDKYVTS